MSFDLAKSLSDELGVPVIGVDMGAVSRTSTLADSRAKVVQTLEDNANHADGKPMRTWKVGIEEKFSPKCFEDKGATTSYIWVSYNRSRLKHGGSNAWEVPKKDVSTALRKLAKAVNDGHFDSAIEERRAKASNGKRRKKSKK